VVAAGLGVWGAISSLPSIFPLPIVSFLLPLYPFPHSLAVGFLFVFLFPSSFLVPYLALSPTSALPPPSSRYIVGTAASLSRPVWFVSCCARASDGAVPRGAAGVGGGAEQITVLRMRIVRRTGGVAQIGGGAKGGAARHDQCMRGVQDLSMPPSFPSVTVGVFLIYFFFALCGFFNVPLPSGKFHLPISNSLDGAPFGSYHADFSCFIFVFPLHF